MALSRREALTLGGVALAAAATGLLVGPRIFELLTDDTGPLKAASFPDLKGQSRTLSEWQGKVLLLNFWATWCVPCREEIPLLSKTRDKYLVSGFEVVGVAIDQASKVAEFAKFMRISYPVLLAEAGGLDLMRALGNAPGGLPFTVFLDREGRIAKRKLGLLRESELEGILARLLR